MSRSAAAVAAERVEVQRPAHRQHALVSPTTNMVPTGLPSRPSRPISVARSTTARNVSSGTCVPAPQVLGAEPFEVLAQVDQAEAVDRLRLCLAADAVIESDDVRPRIELLLATASSRARLMRSASGWGPDRCR